MCEHGVFILPVVAFTGELQLHPSPLFFLQSEYGSILKALSTANKNLRGCYLEEMRLLPPGVQEPILSLQILHSDRSLFVGLNDRVLKIPLERCSSYRTER